MGPRQHTRTVLLSVKPRYADLIERGVKVVEFRRRFPKSIQAAPAIFYVTAPVQELQLAGQIEHVQRGSPLSLWRDFSRLAGVEREDYDAYFAGSDQGVALILRHVRRVTTPLALASPRLRAIGFKPPQSLSVLLPDAPLLRVLGNRRKLQKILVRGASRT